MSVYKTEQVEILSERLGVPKTQIKEILTAYVDYLRSELDMGMTVKFLNVCYLVNREYEDTPILQETNAYIATEIAEQLKCSAVLVQRVFQEFEEVLMDDLKKDKKYTIRGLFTIKLEKDIKGNYKVRTKKSTAYAGENIYVTSTLYFKRKVGVMA